MKLAILGAVCWLILGLMRIPVVHSWSFLPDGNPSHWWDMVGIRVFIAILFIEIAVYERKLGKNSRRN